MKKHWLLLIIFMMGYFCFTADHEATVSVQNYLDYLQTLQNMTEKATEGSSLQLQDVFDFGKIEGQIHSLLIPENLNNGRWQESIRKNKHASLMVFFLAIGGIIILLYGYKLFPFLMMVFGAFFGAITTYNVMRYFFEVSENQLVLWVILGAIIAAVAALLLKNIFIVLVGASFGLFCAQFILVLLSLPLENTLLFTVFITVLFAVSVLFVKRLFIFFFTSLCSSMMCVFAAQYLILEVFQSASYKEQLFSYASIVLFLVLFITGFFIQYKTNKS